MDPPDVRAEMREPAATAMALHQVTVIGEHADLPMDWTCPPTVACVRERVVAAAAGTTATDSASIA
jgi:hypothetical protein